ncbi:MAG: hypothetical protein LBD04_04710 [Synergistaceae bacterium]|nr:hypothetical protein [Synergistaceae bacterium]
MKLVKMYGGDLPKISDAEQTLGGMFEGGKGRESLARYVANNLSRDLKDRRLPVEMRFFSTDGLDEFRFKKEIDDPREPGSNEFSMFRLLDRPLYLRGFGPTARSPRNLSRRADLPQTQVRADSFESRFDRGSRAGEV